MHSKDIFDTGHNAMGSRVDGDDDEVEGRKSRYPLPSSVLLSIPFSFSVLSKNRGNNANRSQGIERH
jgi:hypothetical protein